MCTQCMCVNVPMQRPEDDARCSVTLDLNPVRHSLSLNLEFAISQYSGRPQATKILLSLHTRPWVVGPHGLHMAFYVAEDLNFILMLV